MNQKDDKGGAASRIGKALEVAIDFIEGLPEHVLLILLLIAMLPATWFLAVSVTEERVKQHYEEQIEEINRAHELALNQQTRESDQLITDLIVKLEKAETKKQEIKYIVKEVPKYVTEKADAQCTITNGFVWMFNYSLSGEVAGVAESRPGDVDAPSDVKASEVAATAADNNSECVQRGKIIEAWQEWYRREKTIYENAKKIIEGAAKK